jgi:hypothetical protein
VEDCRFQNWVCRNAWSDCRLRSATSYATEPQLLGGMVAIPGGIITTRLMIQCTPIPRSAVVRHARHHACSHACTHAHNYICRVPKLLLRLRQGLQVATANRLGPTAVRVNSQDSRGYNSRLSDSPTVGPVDSRFSGSRILYSCYSKFYFLPVSVLFVAVR